MTTKKKKNQIDATLRNVRAANKRIKALEKQVLFLEEFLVEQCPETWKDFLAQKQAKK